MTEGKKDLDVIAEELAWAVGVEKKGCKECVSLRSLAGRMAEALEKIREECSCSGCMVGDMDHCVGAGCVAGDALADYGRLTNG